MPSSHLQGGGPPLYEKISAEIAQQEFGRPIRS